MAEIEHDSPDSGIDRKEHPDYVRTQPTRVRLMLVDGTRCFGDIHVQWPHGRVSDVLNDERRFIPLTNVVVEGDATTYSFLTVAKTQIGMVFEIVRQEPDTS